MYNREEAIGVEAGTTKDMEEEADTKIIQEAKGDTLMPNGLEVGMENK